MNSNLAIWVSVVGASGASLSAVWAIWIAYRGAHPRLARDRSARHVYDVFLAYSREDSSELARQLTTALRELHVNVWLDQDQIRIGDNLFEKIDEGMDRSRYGLVILSPHFFDSTWSNRELEALVKRESGGSPSILPVWNGISEGELLEHAPALASKAGLSASENDVNEIASAIASITGGERGARRERFDQGS
jgi:hypothetical protein